MLVLVSQGKLDAIDVDKAVEFVLSCMNFDGGFGCRPGSESHAGQVCPSGSENLKHQNILFFLLPNGIRAIYAHIINSELRPLVGETYFK